MKANIVLKSNAIFTGLEKTPFKGAVAITGNHISYVGKDPVPSDYIDGNTKFYDLEDQMVLPGFSDAHAHYLLAATILSDYCCTEISEAESEEECIEILKKFRLKHPNLTRLIGFGWFPVNWTKGATPHKLPNKKSLDAAFPDIPVYLMMADCHTFWCNSKALSDCKIHKDMKYNFGYLGIGPDNEPDGILAELELIAPCYNEFYNFPEKESEEIQENLLKEIAKAGITSCTDVAECTVITEDASELKKIKHMEQSGKLTARFHVYPSLGVTPDFTIQKKLREEYSSSMVKIAGLKQFFDGVTPTYTAALLEPYTDKPDELGRLNYSKEVYDACITAANREGFGVKIHAIGDGAVRTALDIFEHSKAINPNYRLCRNSIEHIENIDVKDIPRFKHLNVTASVQPIHLVQDADEKIIRIGEKRSRYEWPFQSLLDMKATLAFGTDAPVTPLNPYENIYAAVTRCDLEGKPTGANPEETISLYDALRAYTYGSAYTHNREDELGTLEVGKLADITVARQNLFELTSEELKECTTAMTIVDGNIVYENL